MSYQKERDEFVGVIVGELSEQPGGGNRIADATALARLILRNAQTIQRLAVEDCNRELTTGERMQISSCTERINAACKPWGITPNYSGDPRGACVKLLLPSGRWNSGGGADDGYCVPTR